MKAAKMIFVVTIFSMTSAAFAGTKCGHILSQQGNGLMKHTTAPAVTASFAQAKTTSTKAVN